MTLCHIVGLLFCISLFGAQAAGQNLVLNPGFEDTASGPSCDVHLECYAKNWFDYFTTADYCRYKSAEDSLAFLLYIGVLPRTGRAMAGGYQYGSFSGVYNREYIQGNLSAPLIAGTQYRLEAWVAPYLQSPVIVSAITTLGFAVTDRHYVNFQSAPRFLIPEVPDVVHNGSAITAVGQWTKITGCFKAHGGETKIILGNFTTDSLSGQRILPGATDSGKYGDFAYYYFDDLSLEEVQPLNITPDTLICRGAVITIRTDSMPGATYRWNTGATTSFITTGKAGTYTVTAEIPPGCTGTASTRLGLISCGEPCPAPVLPNAFTPNGDGRNDIFRVANESAIDFLSLAVFNRWGQKLFHTFKSGESWDGRFNGVACEEGGYMYLLRYRDCISRQSQVKGGTVNLLY